MDASGRRKSGVAADFDVYQQLLTDITGHMRGAKAAKVAKKSDKKAKCDRLETFSENLREVASKHQVIQEVNECVVPNGRANEISVSSGETLPLTLSTTQVNSAIANYLEQQMHRKDQNHELRQRELQIEYDLRQAQLESVDRKWAEEAGLRGEEAQLHREELKLLRLQMGFISRSASHDIE
ncbi:hypothetical protein AeRB84_011714 [Aphanomyces euteiches]|nr:hypothetical protein AeRB84_011714 [Aphanomyces euteiches]